MDEKTMQSLIEKVKRDGGDEDFVYTLQTTIEKEMAGAAKSKKDYFCIEYLVIIFSMLASIFAAVSAMSSSIWNGVVSSKIKFVVDILSVSLPAVVTAMIALRGIKSSFETWIRHRKYNLAFNLLINDYLYGSKDFTADGHQNYILFRDRVQELYRQSMEEFLGNMKK